MSEENVKEDAVVENDNVEAVKEDVAIENEGFDPKKFLSDDVVDNNVDSEEGNSDNENKEVVSNDGGSDDSDSKGNDDDFIWPDLPDLGDGNEDKDDAEAVKEDAEDVNQKKEDVGEVKTVEEEVISNEKYVEFAKELGLEAESLDEIKTAIDDIVKENKELKDSVKYSGNTNERVEKLEKYLKLDDAKLVRASLETEGLKGDKLDLAIDKYTDNGLLEIEALKIRNNIDKAIQSERTSISKSEEAEVAKQQESRIESVKSFTEYMQSQDSLFGFKLTGDSDNLPKVRSNHVEYVTSGTYLSEITSNEQNLAESSWLWRNREVLKKAFSNNGRQQGRSDILNKIGNPEKPSSSTMSAPGDSKEFDPKKFMAG